MKLVPKTPPPLTPERAKIAAHMREVAALEVIAKALMENPQKYDDQNVFIGKQVLQLEAVEECYKEILAEQQVVRAAIDALYLIVLESQREEVRGKWYDRFFRKV